MLIILAKFLVCCMLYYCIILAIFLSPQVYILHIFGSRQLRLGNVTYLSFIVLMSSGLLILHSSILPNTFAAMHLWGGFVVV